MLGTIIVILILAVLICVAVISIIKNKKKGKNVLGCGGNCLSCIYNCPQKKE